MAPIIATNLLLTPTSHGLHRQFVAEGETLEPCANNSADAWRELLQTLGFV